MPASIIGQATIGLAKARNCRCSGTTPNRCKNPAIVPIPMMAMVNLSGKASSRPVRGANPKIEISEATIRTLVIVRASGEGALGSAGGRVGVRLTGIANFVMAERIGVEFASAQRAEPVETLPQPHHLTDDKQRRGRQAVRRLRGAGESRLENFLPFGGGVGDERCRVVGPEAAGQEAIHDFVDMLQCHIENQHLCPVGERLPVQIVGDRAGEIVAGHKGDGGGGGAMGHRNAGIGKPAHSGRDSGDHPERYIGSNQRQGLFTAASEQEGVSPFQAQHLAPCAGERDQPCRDVRLPGGRLAAAFSGIDQLGIRTGQCQDTLVYQSVMYYRIGALQRMQGTHGQQGRVTGAGPDEPDPAGLKVGQGEMVQIHVLKLAPDRWSGNRAAGYDAAMNETSAHEDQDEGRPNAAGLRRGWTTGACATAAAKAAYEALLGGEFPDPVSIRLPRGLRAEFSLAGSELSPAGASATVIKDAGDDPDVTHGAEIISTVAHGPEGSGVRFAAGPGVGVVTLPGLPVPPGEPAINPKPREMIVAALEDVAGDHGVAPDVLVTISIPGGEALAEKTANPRLGIVGGLSVLGTTGVVIPYSCASWVHSIHRAVDVARATGITHVAAATGRTSEAAVRDFHGLGERALIDMGDFAGATLKYVRAHPVPRLTLAGGFGKLSKLAAGHMDLHSSRSAVDIPALAQRLADLGARPASVREAEESVTAGGVLEIASKAGLGEALCEGVARGAREVSMASLGGAADLDVLIVARDGRVLAHVGP